MGYIGGEFSKPTYRDVCSHKTCHAETLDITFDASKVSYNELLEVFWPIHDLSTLNRRGSDICTQYRSTIFYLNSEQEEKAKSSKKSARHPNGLKIQL